MILLPAIDILDGKAVRLTQGDYGAKTVYDTDPLEAAKRWVDGGSRALHVVDLDGARTGKPVNLAQVERIAGGLGVSIQLGGGLRSLRDADHAIAAGASRIVLGTAAYSDVDFLDEVLRAYDERVVVSVDARNGKLAASGWTEQTEMDVVPAIERLGGRGVKRFVFSSIERDGMLIGPDLDAAVRVAGAVRGTFVYS
ncbi:MAG: 1-(5-phosphoribosyl)-5-[(5-phosphoribosylamino)methylideneamino]imidazole-4-carboxamide isomerase, partial [Solirubrobacteraceae bacterium]